MADVGEPSSLADIPPCECWRLPDGSGAVIPAGVLTRYPMLSVQLTSEVGPWLGRPWGTCWAGRSGNRSRHLLVLRDELYVLAVPEGSLTWVSPMRPTNSSQPELFDATQRFIGDVRDHLLRADEVVTIARDSDYDQIEVTVRTRSHICEPGLDPLRHPRRTR